MASSQPENVSHLPARTTPFASPVAAAVPAARWTRQRVADFLKYELRFTALDHWERCVFRELLWFVSEETHETTVLAASIAQWIDGSIWKVRETLGQLESRGVIRSARRVGKAHAHVFRILGPNELVALLRPPAAVSSEVPHHSKTVSSESMDYSKPVSSEVPHHSKTVSSESMDHSKPVGDPFRVSPWTTRNANHHLSDRSSLIKPQPPASDSELPCNPDDGADESGNGDRPVVVVVTLEEKIDQVVGHWWNRIGQNAIGGAQVRGELAAELREAIGKALQQGVTVADCVDAIDGAADEKLGGSSYRWCKERGIWGPGLFGKPLLRLVKLVRDARARAQNRPANARSAPSTDVPPISVDEARQTADRLARMGCSVPAALRGAVGNG
jgi:hypothetical protein